MHNRSIFKRIAKSTSNYLSFYPFLLLHNQQRRHLHINFITSCCRVCLSHLEIMLKYFQHLFHEIWIYFDEVPFAIQVLYTWNSNSISSPSFISGKKKHSSLPGNFIPNWEIKMTTKIWTLIENLLELTHSSAYVVTLRRRQQC